MNNVLSSKELTEALKASISKIRAEINEKVAAAEPEKVYTKFCDNGTEILIINDCPIEV